MVHKNIGVYSTTQRHFRLVFCQTLYKIPRVLGMYSYVDMSIGTQRKFLHIVVLFGPHKTILDHVKSYADSSYEIKFE